MNCSSDPREPCRECKEKIISGAKKCIHCDSYQDWRGILPISSSVLALVVALLSILTVGTPIIVNSLSKDGTKIAVTTTGIRLGCIGNPSKPAFVIEAFVTNRGKRPGVLESVYLKNKSSGVEHDLIYRKKGNNTVGGNPASSLIDAGGWQLASLYIRDEDLSKLFNKTQGRISPDKIPYTNIALEGRILNFKGVESKTPIPFNYSKKDLVVDACGESHPTRP